MFDANDLANMRAAQTGHMQDTCAVQTEAHTFDSYGAPVSTFTEGAALACGLEMRPGSERHGPENTVTIYDAILRLAITTTIAAKDRVRVTKRHGESLATALVYEVLSPVQRGPSGIRVLLRKIEV